MESEFSDCYKIFWYREKNSTNKSKISIGEVRNFTKDGRDHRSIPIICDNRLIEKINMRFIATNWRAEGPRIILNDSLLSMSLEIIEAAIWHEIGHVHYKHSLRTQTISQEELICKRISYVRKGLIMPEEREADIFAVKMIGEGPLLKYLRLCFKIRANENKGNLNDPGLIEIKLRMKKNNRR